MKLFTKLIEEKNFHNAYAKAIQVVIREGANLTIGGTEQRKPIKDSCMLISLTGNAIKQVENRQLHPHFPTKRIHLDEYCKEFTVDFLKEYEQKSGTEIFDYLYIDRIINYPTIEGTYLHHQNQLYNLCKHLEQDKEENISSNRQQAITWIPSTDFGWSEKASPCLQRIQIRYIPKNKVDVHLTWRSRDLYSAWQSNVICIMDMLNREVIKPNNCEIERIIDFSDSLHIYITDLDEAKKVKLVPVSPQEMSR
jgi:thymidylate synthase